MNKEYQLFSSQPQTIEIGIHYKGIKLITYQKPHNKWLTLMCRVMTSADIKILKIIIKRLLLVSTEKCVLCQFIA